MQLIEKKSNLRKVLGNLKKCGKTIGFVPTMGFLHDGHLSLMRQAKRENDVVVVSIFVNPTQFGPNEDLAAYPRDIERDKNLMANEKVDIVFVPEVKEIYPDGFATYVEVEGPITQVLCAKSRPTHFRGVTTVVAKLFHIVAPTKAYFGQKDAQQVAVIRKMVKDLSFDLQIVPCPIVREPDGLAMSSRNTYLSAKQRTDALILHQAILAAQNTIKQGERCAVNVTRQIESHIHSVPEAVIDYIAVVDSLTLMDLEILKGEILIALAVKFGKTRLIDNTILNVS